MITYLTYIIVDYILNYSHIKYRCVYILLINNLYINKLFIC